MKAFGYFIVGLVILSFLGFACTVITMPGWFAGRSVDVIKQEIDPQVLLNKYMWFKDASASLDAKQADIAVYQLKITRLQGLKGLDRTDREQLMVWEQEVAGIKASYNQLAADYNSQMSKINWRFCNVGQLPQGATVPLPREYKPYQEQ